MSSRDVACSWCPMKTIARGSIPTSKSHPDISLHNPNNVVEFQGKNNSIYLRVDKNYIKCIKRLKHRSQIVIAEPTIKLLFSLEFDRKHTISLSARSKQGFTREDLAIKIAQTYQSLFEDPQKNKVCDSIRLSNIRILCIYRCLKSGKYLLDVDLQ